MRGSGLAFALVWLAGASAPLSSRALDVAGRCSVSFAATTTLHDFEGKAPCELLQIEPPDPSGVYRARAEVAVARIDTGIAARNERMREMFEAERYPRITVVFANVDPDALRANRPG